MMRLIRDAAPYVIPLLLGGVSGPGGEAGAVGNTTTLNEAGLVGLTPNELFKYKPCVEINLGFIKNICVRN